MPLSLPQHRTEDASNLSHYLIKAPCAAIPSAHGKQPVLLELLSITRRKGLSCGLASTAVVLGGLLCSSVEGGKLEKA